MSRNFIVNATPFLVTVYATPFLVTVNESAFVAKNVVSLLAACSSFMNGSFAPEIVMKIDPPFKILQLLQKFSSTLQFITSLKLPRILYDSRVFLHQQVTSSRYFSRQLVRLEFRDITSWDIAPQITRCLQQLRALRSLGCSINFTDNKTDILHHENDLVNGFQHLDLDELKLSLASFRSPITPTILENIWEKNPMRRLKTFELNWDHPSNHQQIALGCISDFHPNLYHLRIFVSGKLISVPDFSVMSELTELRLQGAALGAISETEFSVGLELERLDDFFLSEPRKGSTTFCHRLTKLELDFDCPQSTLKFFIRRLGTSKNMRDFALLPAARSDQNDSSTMNRFSRSTSRKYSAHPSCDPEYLNLLIERYPLLSDLHIGEYTSALTEEHTSLISKMMTNLQVLVLPVREDSAKIMPVPALSVVRDRCVDGTLERVVLSSRVSIGLEDVRSVFGSSLPWGLKGLHATNSHFDTIQSIFSFLCHFSSTLEFIALPSIASQTRPERTDDAFEFPLMPSLKELHIDAEKLETYSCSALLSLLLKVSPHLEVFCVEYPEARKTNQACLGWNKLRDERNLTELFGVVAENLNQSTRNFVTVVLDQRVAYACGVETWSKLGEIKSLRRVTVGTSPICGEKSEPEMYLPQSAILIESRPDVLKNFRA